MQKKRTFAALFSLKGVALVRNASILKLNKRKDCVNRTCMSGHSHTILSTKLLHNEKVEKKKSRQMGKAIAVCNRVR